MADEYDQALDREGRDLVALARASQLARPMFRDEDVSRALDTLRAHRSLVLIGPLGVGKTAIIHGLAHALAASGNSAPIIEYSTTLMLANTKYLGELETKINKVVEAARAKKAILYLKDLWNLTSAGVTRHSTRSVLDALRGPMEAGKLVVLGEVTPEQWRLMARSGAVGTLFEAQNVAPLPPEASDAIVASESVRLGVALDAPLRAAMAALMRRFAPHQAPPGPAIRLLEQLARYAAEKQKVGEPTKVDLAFVEKVFAIYSGLPLFVVSQRATLRAQDIRDWFRARIVGQEAAIEAVVDTITLFKAGLNDPTKPIGTLLLVGPTGVGKTELARALATYLFGSPQRMLRFDLGKFKDYHSFEDLLGSGDDPTRPAALLDPVRAQPFQVVLFDELEKAHQNVWDMMLSLLDEGRMTSPAGEVVDFKSTILVCTSNVGAEAKTVGIGTDEAALRTTQMKRTLDALRQEFRPELLNRFQHIVVFHALSAREVRQIARQELSRMLDREGITGRNLLVDVDDSAIERVIERGYDARFGARALKREIERQVVLPLAVTLMEKPVEPGQVVKITGKDGQIRVRLIETELVREARREREPVRAKDGRKLGRDAVPAAVAEVRSRIAALSGEVDEPALVARRQALEAEKLEPDFWAQPARAASVIDAIDALDRVLERIERLRGEADELSSECGAATFAAEKRERVERVVRRLDALEDDLRVAWIELVSLGEAGRPDAIVEIEPVGGARGAKARDLLVTTYRAWAEARGCTTVLLREPQAAEEVVVLALRGAYAAGYLAGECGLHRVQEGDDSAVARVRVVPWVPELRPAYPLDPPDMRALKSVGVYGGKIRSRLDCGDGLVLANERTLAANRELAAELWPSWCARPEPSDRAVRRYDLDAPLFTDAATGVSTGRPDTLSPGRFHQLLAEVAMGRGAP